MAKVVITEFAPIFLYVIYAVYKLIDLVDYRSSQSYSKGLFLTPKTERLIVLDLFSVHHALNSRNNEKTADGILFIRLLRVGTSAPPHFTTGPRNSAYYRRRRMSGTTVTDGTRYDS